MGIPVIPSTGDPRYRLADDLFERLTRAAFDARGDVSLVEARLWQLPEVAVYFTFGAVTDEERAAVDPAVHRLRLAAAEIINTRLDRSTARSALDRRVRVASAQYVLREWQPDDAGALAQFLTSESLWARLPETYPGEVGPELAGDLISASNGAPDRHEVRAALWHGTPVGQVRLQFDSSPYPDSAEMSYWLGEPFWGRGIATDLVTLATARAFETRAGLARLFARVLEGNVASLRVLEKSGYRHESFKAGQVEKEGRRLGVYTLGVCREDYAFERTVERPAATASLIRSASCALMCSEVWQMATLVQGFA